MNSPKCITKDDSVRTSYSEDAAGNCLLPAAVARPSSTDELLEVLKHCNESQTAFTPAGGKSCYTGACLAEQGLVVASDKLNSIIEINKEERFVVAKPGIYLGQLKESLLEHNLFYPPAPTSEDIAMLGGTLATNASGASGYKYGATADWVEELEVALPTGDLITVSNSRATKINRGPAAFRRPTDLFIGSEGIFGFITKAKLKLLPEVPPSLSLLAFFKNTSNAIRLSASLIEEWPDVQTVEFFDAACLTLLQDKGTFSQVPDNASMAVLLKLEGEIAPQAWLERLGANDAISEATLVADTESKQAELKRIRHFIPSTLNELGLAATKTGGKKIATDCAVPIQQLEQMFQQGEELSTSFGFSEEDVFRFGHLGDAHPHYNIIAKNTDMLEKAEQLRTQLAKLALSLGGTVSAEHGIGKLRKHLFKLEVPVTYLNSLLAIKRELDPKLLAAPGNLL